MSYARVLIVDDNVVNLEVASSLIGFYGIKVDCTTDAKEAIEAIRAEKVRYNAIFMDYVMPEINGKDALRIIREQIGTDYAKSIPVIALTADAIVGNEEDFLKSGFQAFVTKPIELTRLDAALREWVRDEDAEALLDEKTLGICKKAASERVLKESIAGLEISRGIAQYAGSEEVYIKALLSFAGHTKPLLERISSVDSDGLGTYSITVHGIRGSAHGIYAEQVAGAAQKLEDAAARGDIEFIRAENPGFIELVSQLIGDIEKACAPKALGKPDKPVKDKPDAELLTALLKAVSELDIDGMDAAMEKIGKYDYTGDAGLAAWLQGSLERGEYSAIKEKLNCPL